MTSGSRAVPVAIGPAVALAALLVAIVFAVYRPALDAGFVNWDDDLIVTGNERFRGLSWSHLKWMATSTYGGHWEPLAWLSLAFDHALWGMDPRGYHLTSIALHALNTVLVYVLALALMRPPAARLDADAAPSVRPIARRIAPFAAALFFALHPLRVESVAWVTERRDVLSASLFLVATLLWLRHARGGGGLAASYVVFALALCAKASGLAYPLIFVGIDLWLLGRVRAIGWRRVIVENLPYAGLAAAAVVPAAIALSRFGATEMGGALSPLQRAAQVGYGAFFYPARTLVPVGLSPLRLLDLDLEPFRARYLMPTIVVAGLTVFLVAARRRVPRATLAWLAYLALIAPFLGLTSNGIHLVADRYAYVACLPFALLAGAGVGRLATTGIARPGIGVVLAGVVTLAIGGALGVTAHRQVGFWHDSTALWNRVLDVEPNNYVARLKRAELRLDAGDRAGADEDLTRAIEARAQYVPALLRRGKLRAPMNLEAALRDFDRAVELRPNDPTARGERGALRIALGDAAGAVTDLDAALRERPGDPWLLLNRGVAHLELGRREAASADLEAALAAAPPNWTHADLARSKAREAASGAGGR